MGRRRKTESQRRAERFGELYVVGKKRLGLRENEICQMIGLNAVSALWARKRVPEKFSLGQLVTLGTAFGWTADDYMAIIRPERK